MNDLKVKVFHKFQLYFFLFSEPSSYADRVLAHVRPKENTSDEPSMPLKVNDRIVWITDDSLEYGIVKWIGQLPEGSEVVAGIEFVSSFYFIHFKRPRAFKARPLLSLTFIHLHLHHFNDFSK